jgi:phosphoribosylanthranilate isomerase
MTAVKICGITRSEDALFVAGCGADALGFIFYPRSPRYIAPEKARQIIEDLSAATENRMVGKRTILSSPGRITTVGVFVNEDTETVRQIVSFCGLDLIQLHGDESPADCSRLPARQVIKALALKTDDDLDIIHDYKVRAILADTHDPAHYGGTGRTSDWKLAVKAKLLAPLILSGGLHGGNIREALLAVGPDGVDINSGVEISPGIKDHAKVKTIIDLIRNAT